MPPGGHVDPNEVPEETARRECKEETGLDVAILGREQYQLYLSQKNPELGTRNLEQPMDLFIGNPAEGKMLQSPLAMLLEEIPAYDDQPAHQHMDFLFVARPLNEHQEITLAKEEGNDIRWFSRDDIEKLNTQSDIFSNVKAYIEYLL